jgi:hypothetical protein
MFLESVLYVCTHQVYQNFSHVFTRVTEHFEQNVLIRSVCNLLDKAECSIFGPVWIFPLICLFPCMKVHETCQIASNSRFEWIKARGATLLHLLSLVYFTETQG